MPEVTRVVRSSYTDRDRDDYSSDDDRSSYSRSRPSGSSYRTVQRYRVTPSRVEGVEEERRSTRLEVVPRAERIEVDRRVERVVEPARARSAMDFRPRSTVIERSYVEREPAREPERERTRTIVYERERPRELQPLRPWERGSDRAWEPERDVRETDIRIEKRTERRDEPYELERYQRETEYYDRPDPGPQPIIIRQRAPEPQQIILQEAPAPLPILLPREEQNYEVVRRNEVQEVARPEPRRDENEFYYRRDVRELGPRRDEDFVAAYDRRDVRPRDSVSDGERSDGSDYVVHRRVVRRDRSRSRSPHHKRHLAEGALAGAGAAALLANHREKVGNAPEHRGRQVIGGAALGAIGAEVLTRARSRYRESKEGRSRSRSSSRHSHTKLKTALGLAAAGLAAAAAVKYAQNRGANKEELGRGRSRTRSVSRRRASGDYNSDGEFRSKHSDPKHRAAQMAKAGVATAAVAGIVEHFRNKSRKRSGERSKSRLRTGAEIAASGLAGAAVAGLYETRKSKEDREEEAERAKHDRKRSRSRARSTGAYSDPGVDPELGMVQYGTDPVYSQQQTTTTYRSTDYDPAFVAGGAGAAYGAAREHRSRSRSHRRHHSSSSDDRNRRSRSRSRVRDIAGAAIGTGAAAIGINQYKKRKERKERERERERRRYEEESSPENYYAQDYRDDGYSPSPPHASGGSYYPETTNFPPPPVAPTGFTQQTNTSTAHVNDGPLPPYNPADYAGQPAPHDPYGYPPPPRAGDNVSSNMPRQSPVVTASHDVPVPVPVPPPVPAAAAPYFPPPPTAPLSTSFPNEHLHDTRDEEDRLRNPSHPASFSSSTLSQSPTSHTDPDRPHNKSVMFAPLSPTSSRRLAKIHLDAHDGQPPARTYQPPEDDSSSGSERHHVNHRRRRRNSDPSSDRPHLPSKHRRRHHHSTRSPSPEYDDGVEVLPDRFDRDGRPLNRRRGGAAGDSGEMVERLMHGFGDVVDGRKSWKDLLSGFVQEAGGAGQGSGSNTRRRN